MCIDKFLMSYNENVEQSEKFFRKLQFFVESICYIYNVSKDNLISWWDSALLQSIGETLELERVNETVVSYKLMKMDNDLKKVYK